MNGDIGHDDSTVPSAQALVAAGLVAGLLSGLFGVGGGIILVPALVQLGMPQRLAAGTSVAAILPTAIVGSLGYALAGDVDLIAAAALAVGVVIGAQIGSLLLAQLSREVLFWSFFVFLLLSIVSLWVSVPSRDAQVELSPLTIALLAVAGLGTGILSAVLGVGGGIVLVPALMFFFGAGDLAAKGTSLLMMIPGSISATIGNRRRRNVDLRAAGWAGLAACVASPLGIVGANLLTPLWANIAFSALLIGVCVRLASQHLRSTAS